MISVIILFVLAAVLLSVAVVCNRQRRDALSGWLLALAIAAIGAMIDELARLLFL